MIVLEEIISDVLPHHVFGEYLREHLARRFHHYGQELLRDFIREFNPYVPEDAVIRWWDARRGEEKTKWNNELYPALWAHLEKDARWYADRHPANQNQEEHVEEGD